MNININNYSKCLLSNDKMPLNDASLLADRSGCNGFIRSSSAKYLYIAIPKSSVDNVLNYVYENTNIKYTLDDVLSIFTEMTFNYTYNFVDTQINFLDNTYNGYYIFEIENVTNKLHRYYAFCMLRHFYYAQDILTTYLGIYNKLETEWDKIIALSLCTSFQQQYSFIGHCIPLINNLTFQAIHEIYCKNSGNTNSLGVVCSNIKSINISTIISNIDIIKNIILNNVDHIKSLIIETNPLLKHYQTIDNDILKWNIDPSYHFIFNNSMNKYINIDGIQIRYKESNIGDLIIPQIPLKLNIIKKYIPKFYNILKPIAPKILVNITSTTRNNNIKTLNCSSIISKLKNRAFINKLTNQEEPNNFPVKFVKKIKTKNDDSFIVNSKKELEIIQKSGQVDFKKFIKQQILKNSNKHYLFFTKKELFLYQIQLEDCIIDDDDPNIKQFILKDTENLIVTCQDIFNNSGLDIGVIVVNVNLKTQEYIIEDICTYVHNGALSSTKYLNEVNNLIKEVCVDNIK